MLVHFTLCVSQVQIAVCKELGFEPEGYTMYRETADASGILSLFFFLLFLFCFVLFCFVLFCFVLFCFVLFCFVLFCFVLF